MRKVQIITDSGSDIPKDLIAKHNIYIVPYFILFGEKTYRDGVDITTPKLYEMVEKNKILPKTAAITPLEWKKHFDSFIEQDYDIVCLTLSSKISSTFQNAYLTSQEYEQGRVVVVDSKSLSGALALLTLKAVKYRDQGMSAVEIGQELDKLVPKMHTQFVIKTLEYLHKGGRCSALARLLGTVLALKPQIKMFDGKLDVYKKSVGKMSRAVDHMLNDFFAVAEMGKLDSEFVFITHSFAPKMEKYIIQKIKQSGLKIQNLIVSHAGVVISTHCGAGTIGILYLEK